MRIAIIGGGWVGCHLASKLRDVHTVTIFEKNAKLFQGSSYSNQNRLHRGYHYARSSKTRELCKDTFTRFTDDYDFLVEPVYNNAYAIPNESVLDYGTYKNIFYNYPFLEANFGLDNLKNIIFVDERYINFQKASDYFNYTLSDNVFTANVPSAEALKDDYDLVVNCTNNYIRDPTCANAFYEVAITLLYEKTRLLEKADQVPFGALTLVDGEFFSIYPYSENTYTLSDVRYTPVAIFNSVIELSKFKFQEDNLEHYKELFTSRVKRYYPEFDKAFSYKGYFLATKAKYKSNSADRYPFISQQGNVINCFTGKIQGIYIVEDYIKNEIARR